MQIDSRLRLLPSQTWCIQKLKGFQLFGLITGGKILVFYSRKLIQALKSKVWSNRTFAWYIWHGWANLLDTLKRVLILLDHNCSKKLCETLKQCAMYRLWAFTSHADLCSSSHRSIEFGQTYSRYYFSLRWEAWNLRFHSWGSQSKVSYDFLPELGFVQHIRMLNVKGGSSSKTKTRTELLAQEYSTPRY